MQKMVIAAAASAWLAAGGCDRGGSNDPNAEDVAAAAAPAIDPSLRVHLPPGTTIEMAEEGRKLFPTCGVCHGLEGEGTSLGPSFRDQDWIGIYGELDEIAGVIRTGVARPLEYPVPMPVLGGGDYDDAQIQALAVYVYLLSRSAAPPAPAPATEAP
jgi:mono/diheme cytochrome c family protein